MVQKKDGVFFKRGEGRRLIFYWRLGREVSKNFNNHTECAMEYVEKFIDRNPKYKELVYDKTWDQIFRVFGIKIQN